MVNVTASSLCYKQSAIIPFCRAVRPIHTYTKKYQQKNGLALFVFLFVTLRLGIGDAYGETFKFIGHEENSNGNDYSAMRYGVRGMQW